MLVDDNGSLTYGECTHNLGFFFGPGLALSLGGASGSMAGGARFLPDALPAGRFFLFSAPGGASELPSVSSLALGGIGVELASDDLSAGSGGCTDGEGSALMDAEREMEGVAGKRESLSAVMCNTMILLFFAPLAVALMVVVVVDDMVDDGRRADSRVVVMGDDGC